MLRKGRERGEETAWWENSLTTAALTMKRSYNRCERQAEWGGVGQDMRNRLTLLSTGRRQLINSHETKRDRQIRSEPCSSLKPLLTCTGDIRREVETKAWSGIDKLISFVIWWHFSTSRDLCLNNGWAEPSFSSLFVVNAEEGPFQHNYLKKVGQCFSLKQAILLPGRRRGHISPPPLYLYSCWPKVFT